MALRRLAPAVWSLRLQAAAQQAAPAFAPALLRGFASGEREEWFFIRAEDSFRLGTAARAPRLAR